MVPNSHIKWYFGPFQTKVDQKWKMAKSEAGSNIAQNDSKGSLIIISSVILAHFSQNIDQYWEKPKPKPDQTLLPMTANVPNSHIKQYFGPFQPKSRPKLKKGQNCSRIEHCLK